MCFTWNGPRRARIGAMERRSRAVDRSWPGAGGPGSPARDSAGEGGPLEPLLEVHRKALVRWRGAMNLVGPGEVDPHYEDAAAAIEVLADDPPSGLWADLGTGAGFPGVVFATRYPEARLELVDSRQKRCVFLEHVLRDAKVPPERVRVRCARIEALEVGSYEGVMARALAPPEAVLGHALRLLRVGGRALVMMGEGAVSPPAGLEAVAERQYRIGGRLRVARSFVRRAPAG